MLQRGPWCWGKALHLLQSFTNVTPDNLLEQHPGLGKLKEALKEMNTETFQKVEITSN